jgi:hypothetical protein
LGRLPRPCRLLTRGLAVFLVALSPSALADAVSDMRDSIRGVLQADTLVDERPQEVSLDSELATFSRLIESGTLNPAGQSIAHYWRGRGYSTLNWARMKKEQQPDPALARKSLEDFNLVIKNGFNVPDWGISVADALYGAGGVARNHLENLALAYEYWQKCAAINHAGCLNIMAGARLTGQGGIKIDLDQSLELNKRVYDTGTSFRCAGAYSAQLIAYTIYFAEMRPTVNELDWMKRAYLLLDELGKEEKIENPCDRAKFEIAEYLMRLARGEQRPELLRSAARRSAETDFRPLARYLLSQATRESFEASLGKIPLKHTACYVHFLSYWHADLQKDQERSASHLNSMVAFGGDHCKIELALIDLKKKR